MAFRFETANERWQQHKKADDHWDQYFSEGGFRSAQVSLNVPEISSIVEGLEMLRNSTDDREKNVQIDSVTARLKSAHSFEEWHAWGTYLAQKNMRENKGYNGI